MKQIEITNDAEQGLIDIYLYGVEHFGLSQAERYLESLYAKMSVAAEHPGFGVDYGFVREGLRRIESQSHAIYFRPSTEGIRILRILSGRMDPNRHLSGSIRDLIQDAVFGSNVGGLAYPVAPGGVSGTRRYRTFSGA